MITAILLRNIKNYGNINFIPICDNSYKYSIYVGNNGVGKSAVLEAVDIFFHNKNWNTTSFLKKSESFICPVFLVPRKRVSSKQQDYFEIISDFFWNVSSEINPNVKNNSALIEFLKYRDGLRAEYEENYYLILIGIEYDNFKSAYFSTFNNSIMEKFKKSGYDESHCDMVLSSIRDLYEYIYIPVEESPQELLKLQNTTMQKMLNKDILAEIEKALNKKTKSMSVVTQIMSNLDAFVNEINAVISKIDDKYSFESELAGRKNLTAKDLRDKVLEAYFPLRTLKVDKRSVNQLSSGEQRKAIIDIAYSILTANGAKATEKSIILAIDEPEMSMHISNCYGQFSRLEELAREYGKQIIITTHWYGFLPIAQNGSMIFIEQEKGGRNIRYFSLFNYTEDRRNYPDVIELKSMYDLATALITYMRISRDCNWIICEGSDDKLYIEQMLKYDSRINILPVGGCGNVVKLFYLMFEPLSEKKERSVVESKVLFLIDTDLNSITVKTPVGLSSNSSPIVSIRRIQSVDGTIKLYDPTVPNRYEQTEIEDCLNPQIYFQAICELIMKGKDEELKKIIQKYHVKEQATLSKLKGDDSCIEPLEIEALKDKNLIIQFAEEDSNKIIIARKYVELCKKRKPQFEYSLANEINNILGVN